MVPRLDHCLIRRGPRAPFRMATYDQSNFEGIAAAIRVDVGQIVQNESSHDSEELPMQTVTTNGLDIAKSVFLVHGVDAAGLVVMMVGTSSSHCQLPAWLSASTAYAKTIGRTCRDRR